MSISCMFDHLAWVYDFGMWLLGNAKRDYLKIKSVAKVKSSDKILEVGGGTGRIAKYFVGNAKEVVVLDPSKKMLQRIKSSKIKKVVGVAQKTIFKSSSFDVIYCVDSFHHFTNGCDKKDYTKRMDICIKELLRILKKDGRLVILDFNRATCMGRVLEIFENSIMRFGSQFYSTKEFFKLFKKFKVKVELNTFKHFYIAKITKT